MSSIVWTALERISSPGHWVVEYRRPRPRSPQENFFDVTFHSISAVDLLIYDFSVHLVLTIYTPNCATVRIHRRTKYLAVNPSDDNTWWAIMSTPSSLLAFHTGKLCLGSMVHLVFFFDHPVLSIIRFLANLFLISFCIQNRLKGSHCLRSPSFCTVCTVCPSRKWRWGYEEAKREKRLRNEQAPN